ncbi:MAG: lipoprotein [Halofilum sp. (in: g-proteobacteria)]|nr:lipoprotein [Halofilum sp. (in: g-proteobacteria)]
MRAFLSATLVALLLLAGCGQKGPLYRPGDEAPAAQDDGG